MNYYLNMLKHIIHKYLLFIFNNEVSYFILLYYNNINKYNFIFISLINNFIKKYNIMMKLLKNCHYILIKFYSRYNKLYYI